MNFVPCPDRDRILKTDGHVLVTGGPGCGKTTVALRKALLRIEAGLLLGQRVLFLSFSRAAVARIVQAAHENLPKESRRYLDIQTFHSFCWQLVRGHGYLLGAASPSAYYRRMMSVQCGTVKRTTILSGTPNGNGCSWKRAASLSTCLRRSAPHNSSRERSTLEANRQLLSAYRRR